MKQLLKKLGRALGVDLKRLPDPALPFVHQIRYRGLTFPFWIANRHAKAWWANPELDAANAQYRTQEAMCSPGSVVFDVGAHHGMNAVLCALCAGPTGQVHAFEANRENALVLSANIGLNRLTHCFCVPAAVGDKDGEVSVAGECVAGSNGLGSKTTMLALDSYCSRQGIPKVDVLIIDVEGFEAAVLRGAKQLLAARPKIDLELHLDDLSRYGHSVADVLGQLDLKAYKAFMMVRPDWKVSAPFTDAAQLPRTGVANLFLWPAD
jgi:FkbM family methyltransferase